MKIEVSVIQESSIFFNKSKCLEKVDAVVRGMTKNGNAKSNYTRLVLFPESFIPGYPRGLIFGSKIGSRTDTGRDDYLKYYENSIDTNGPEIAYLEKLCQETGVYLVIGATEQKENSGSLFCSMLYFSPTSGLLGIHRKIKPTAAERIVWHEASGDSLVTFDTSIGRLGGLICWENYMPLARMSMYQQAVQIYVAPTADARDSWITSMQHIAREGRCFVLSANQYFTKSMYPRQYQEQVKDEPEVICRGGSVIVSPMGEIIAGPLWDQSGILTTEIDLDEITKAKLDFDPTGHYSRDDIFKFEVTNQPGILKE